MIENELQYKITKGQAEKFTEAMQQFESNPKSKEVHPLLYKAQLDALTSQRDELLEQLVEYEYAMKKLDFQIGLKLLGEERAREYLQFLKQKYGHR